MGAAGGLRGGRGGGRAGWAAARAGWGPHSAWGCRDGAEVTTDGVSVAGASPVPSDLKRGGPSPEEGRSEPSHQEGRNVPGGECRAQSGVTLGTGGGARRCVWRMGLRRGRTASCPCSRSPCTGPAWPTLLPGASHLDALNTLASDLCTLFPPCERRPSAPASHLCSSPRASFPGPGSAPRAAAPAGSRHTNPLLDCTERLAHRPLPRLQGQGRRRGAKGLGPGPTAGERQSGDSGFKRLGRSRAVRPWPLPEGVC